MMYAFPSTARDSGLLNARLLALLEQLHPPYIDSETNRNDKVVVCLSGGKDSSLALLLALAIYGHERVIAHYQVVEEDPEGTIAFNQALCAHLRVPFYTRQAMYWGYECLDCGHHYLRQAPLQVCTKCQSTSGSQIAIVKNLLDLVAWRGMWPDSRVRYCTKFLKSAVFNLWAAENRTLLGEHPLVVLGERWSESTGRAELPEIRAREGAKWLTEFRPVLPLRRFEVFRALRDAGIDLHPCYRLLWRAMLRGDLRGWYEQGKMPHTSYEGQWTGLLDGPDLLYAEQALDGRVEGMIDTLMYDVIEENKGPRMACVNCVLKPEAQLAASATLPGAALHFRRGISIEDRTGHLIKKGRSLRVIVAGSLEIDSEVSCCTL
jgi:3'-phosphoadenosine 5'-phosphosulfate sulfotransferase (PAPS reductase)/FAD synthetase